MFYQNISRATKTFYGVTFKPGEIHDVPGYINDIGFERCAKPKAQPKPEPKPKSQPKVSDESKPASQPTKPTKEEKEETVDGKDSNQ